LTDCFSLIDSHILILAQKPPAPRKCPRSGTFLILHNKQHTGRFSAQQGAKNAAH